MMKPNIGIVNALVRITIGFSLLAWATAEMGRRRTQQKRYICIAMLAGMKIGEGITRFCPVVALMNKSGSSDDQDEKNIINPS